MSAALLSLDQIKTALGITDSASDDKLTAAMPVITEYFENYCKRGLAYVVDCVEELPLTRRLALLRYPVEVVSELLINDVAAPTIPPPALDASHGIVFMGASGFPIWCAPPSIALITYTGGYPDDEVPADLADVYARCCADYGGVTYSVGASAGGAPLKSLGLGSGALTVAFDTAAASHSAYDTSAVPSLLAPYLFVLEHYRVKDFV